MSAKSELLGRLQYLNAAVVLPQLVDNGISANDHNGAANLLRKGLGIVAFNVLEDFIKNKTEEALSLISNSRLPFADLTDHLQDAAVIGALKSLVFRAEMQRKDGTDQWRTLIQEEALKIHSTGNPTYELSKFSLASSGSNISSGEVSDILKGFGILGGWQSLKSVSDKIGGGIPDLAQAYNNAASRRHSAAHVASFNYTHPWLANLRNEILAIASSLDILIQARCRQVLAAPSTKIDLHNISDQLNFRFLEPKSGIFRETTTIGGRSIKNWASLNAGISSLQPRLNIRNEFLIILNSSKRIDDWHV